MDLDYLIWSKKKSCLSTFIEDSFCFPHTVFHGKKRVTVTGLKKLI